MSKLRIIAFVVIVIIALTASISIYFIVKQNHDIYKADYNTNEAMLVELKEGLKSYQKDNNKEPEKFSAFVQLDGELNHPFTVTLDKYTKNFIKPSSQNDLESNVFIVEYNSGLLVDMFIEDGDVITSYHKVDD
ncbi:MAG: hypothetical protein AB1782_16260 [Cyanobacteriota bacterium]